MIAIFDDFLVVLTAITLCCVCFKYCKINIHAWSNCSVGFLVCLFVSHCKLSRLKKKKNFRFLILAMNAKKQDIFRDTYIRYMGYANELGESFRPLVRVGFVRLSYVIASGYVITDSIHKMYDAKQNYEHQPHDQGNKMKDILKAGIDCLVWQSFASVIIPGITINRIVKLSSYSIRKTHKINHSAVIRKSVPTAIGLISIPLIIHPIDTFVHFAMNSTLRPWMNIKKH